MASERSGILSEGALYETIARGNKDTYFLSKDISGTTVNPFETRYLRTPGTVSELRRTTPLNAPDFGRACEFEFDVAGDVFIEPTVLIDLPSWLPPAESILNQTSGYVVDAPTTPGQEGRYYGYSRGIAYFLFSKIQIFQDKILLQEFSGDALWASRLSRDTLNSASLDQALSGMTNPMVTPLYRNATPGRLRLTLPMIGGANGLPSIGMRQQTFRLRLFLRALEDCVECSDDTVLRPAPWTEPVFEVFTLVNFAETYKRFQPIARELIAKPVLQLESRHIYADPESRAALESKNHEIPYSLLYENTFTFGGLDFNTSRVSVPAFTRIIDARHPASRVFWFLRTQDDLGLNRRWKTYSDVSGNPYYKTMSLVIASRDRESKFTPLIWNTMSLHAKEDRTPPFTIGEMNWDIGSYTGRQPGRVPEGSVNFSTADKPIIYIELLPPIPPQVFTSGVIEMLFVVESWSLYTIEEGRGALRYGN
jgi:hypothetical protein